MNDERRKFVRVSADCSISFRKSGDADHKSQAGYEKNNPISSFEVSGIASKIRTHGDQREDLILELLLWIDWKVNYLIQAMAEDKRKSGFPYEAYMIDLSGDGMRFSSYEQAAVGAILQFRFFLPLLPFKEMVIEGVVNRIRQRAVEEDSTPLFEMGVQFVNPKASDQETIFRYVAKRERQLLHEQRERETEGYIP